MTRKRTFATTCFRSTLAVAALLAMLIMPRSAWAGVFCDGCGGPNGPSPPNAGEIGDCCDGKICDCLSGLVCVGYRCADPATLDFGSAPQDLSIVDASWPHKPDLSVPLDLSEAPADLTASVDAGLSHDAAPGCACSLAPTADTPLLPLGLVLTAALLLRRRRQLPPEDPTCYKTP